jgi:hypothetical protein
MFANTAWSLRFEMTILGSVIGNSLHRNRSPQINPALLSVLVNLL